MDSSKGTDALTDRELQVLRLIVAGKANQEIADELFLTLNTIKTYVRSAYRTMNVTNRPQAIVWGVRHGLLKGFDV